MCQISEILFILFLLYCSVCDIKMGVIKTKILLLGILPVSIYAGFISEETSASIICGMLLGGSFLFVSYFTREALGYADSILLALLGTFLGVEKLLFIMLLSFGSVAVFSLVGIVCKHWDRDKTIPFVPFLLLGYMGVMIL